MSNRSAISLFFNPETRLNVNTSLHRSGNEFITCFISCSSSFSIQTYGSLRKKSKTKKQIFFLRDCFYLKVKSQNGGLPAGQLQSWTKVLGQIYIFGAFSHSPNKLIYTCSAVPLPPPPSYNVGHVYTLFLQSFNIVLVEGTGGGEATHFKTGNSGFF